jgi:O-antigen/teichoic acid export membrane protein
MKSKANLTSGGLWLGLAKLWFLVASYAITISLTHLLDAAVFGQYYAVARLIAVPNMVIIYTLLFAVSRPLAAQYGEGFPAYGALRRRGVRLAVGLGGATALVFFLGAPAFADWLSDPGLVDPIRVVAPISLIYAVYAVNLGTLNAVRRFSLQATLDISMATMKAGFIVGAAVAGLGLAYTVGGFTAASLLALALSSVLVLRARPDNAGDAHAHVAPMARFVGALIVFTAIVNVLQSVDVLILKAFSRTEAQDAAVGFYASAQQVALVPYSLMNAVALLMFPLIASLEGAADRVKIKTYVQQTARVCVLLLAFMSAIGSAASGEVQALLFPKAYGAAATELRWLVWGFSGYSFAVTVAWIFNSTRRSWEALVLVAVPLVVVVVATRWLIPVEFTTGAAQSVGLAGAAGVLVAAGLLWRAFGATLGLLHMAKLVAAVVAVELVAAVLPIASTGGLVGKALIVGKLGVLSAVFVGVVLGTKAVTVAQIRELRRAG